MNRGTHRQLGGDGRRIDNDWPRNFLTHVTYILYTLQTHGKRDMLVVVLHTKYFTVLNLISYRCHLLITLKFTKLLNTWHGQPFHTEVGSSNYLHKQTTIVVFSAKHLSFEHLPGLSTTWNIFLFYFISWKQMNYARIKGLKHI